jgi:adenine-specific DNA-methyltransferase
MKRQYAANYHLLETIARGDEPDAVGISGLRPWRDQYSDFCSKLKIRGAFERILRQIKCPEVLISYSEDGLLSRNEMLNFLESFGQVRYMEYGIPRFKSNRGGSGGFVTEYFFFLSLR